MKSVLHFNRSLFTMITAVVLLVIASCNKKFDEPPLGADPDIPVTMTIKELKSRYASAGNFQKVEEDKVISGIVTADDRTGNFFNQIVIQDATGGIPVLIDKSSLYVTYPVGRRVYVKVKGLMLGDYGGTIQLGLDSFRTNTGYLNVGRIPATMLDSYLITGSVGNTITPKIVKPSDFTGAINDSLLSMFVQINNAEFKDADLVKTYADPAHKATVSAVNFTIKPCNDTKSVVLRNSSYATFAGVKVPQGNGPLVGISSVFNGTIQLTIRDTSDVQFKGPRCNGQTPVGTTKTITEIMQYAKGDSTIPAGTWIEGVIVSDTKNESAGNYRIQDGTAGIQIRFAKDNNPTPGALGDKLKVYVGGSKLSVFSGGLQINGPDVSQTTGTGTVTPRVVTIAQITQNMRAWESTVVTINNVIINGSGSNYTITDATGSLATFIRTSSGITMPTGATSITGYVNVFQATSPVPIQIAQVTLRTQEDIVGGTTTPPQPSASTEDFEKAVTKAYADNVVQALTIGDWRLGTETFVGSPSATGDLGEGSKSIRFRGTNTTDAFINSEFDAKGLKTVSLKFGGALFSESTDADKEIKIEVFKSTDGGITWTSIGTKVGVRGSFTDASFNTNAAATDNVRIKIVNASFLRSTNNRLRINVDNVTFTY